MIGKSIAHYQVTALLGEGGMGQVYRATDLRLAREVALKVLPAHLAEDPDRLLRMRREAQVLAALNHPNIAAIYGLEEAGDIHFLVMELVPGQSLAERLTTGRIPITESIEMAAQMVEALAAAHARGIVHRDLKPANIQVSPDGQVKLLDFGLAKALEAGDETSDLSHSPTLTQHSTQAGVLLGTAAYMSPEQARGQEVDRKADIWAFGVVLFEMLTGEKLFPGESLSDVFAAVLRDEVDLNRLPSDTPAGLRNLLGWCLERDPKQRLQEILDGRRLLQEAESGAVQQPATGVPASTQAGWSRRRLALMALVPLLLGLLLGIGISRWNPPDSLPEMLEVGLHPPDGIAVALAAGEPGIMVPSPDGSRIVFSGIAADGSSQLYVRELATGVTRALEGTEGPQYPFWSPDGEWIGFFERKGGFLRKIRATGGPAIPLASAISGKGGTWGPDGSILFAPSFSDDIYRVSEWGGGVIRVTQLDAQRFNSYRHPRFLPDGKHFVYMARSADPRLPSTLRIRKFVAAGDDVAETADRELTPSESQGEPIGDYLLWRQEGALFAQLLDPEKMELMGSPAVLLDNIESLGGAQFAVFAVSASGILIYHPNIELPKTQLEWRDRAGNRLGTLGRIADYDEVQLSPDGQLAVGSLSHLNGGQSLWLFDLQREEGTRLTFDAGDQFEAHWFDDSRTIAYASNEATSFDIYRMRVDEPGKAERIYSGNANEMPADVAPDGSILFLPEPGFSTSLQRLVPGSEAETVLEVEEILISAKVSPDGRWLAYSAMAQNESGGRAVSLYLARYPTIAALTKLDSDGTHPLWGGGMGNCSTRGRTGLWSAGP